MGIAAYQKRVEISDDDGVTWEHVPASTASLDQSGTVLDDSALGFNEGQRSRLIGIIEWGVSMTVNYDTDGEGAAAVTILRAAWLGRDTLLARYLPDGENGFEGPVVVETFNMSGGVDDLETVEVSLLSNGVLGTDTVT